MTLFAIWIFCGLAAAALASARGHNAILWLVIGILLGPLALLGAAVAPKDAAEHTRLDLLDGRLRRCPECAEAIRREAKRCRFCGSEVLPPEPFTLSEKIFGRRD